MFHHFRFIHWLSHIRIDSDMAFLFSEDWLSFLVILTKLPKALFHVFLIAACSWLLSKYRHQLATQIVSNRSKCLIYF